MGMENDRLNNKITTLNGKLSHLENINQNLRSQIEINQKSMINSKNLAMSENYTEIIANLEKEVMKYKVNEVDWTKSVQNNKDLHLMVEKLCSERDSLLNEISLIKESKNLTANQNSLECQLELNKKDNKLIEVSNQVRMLATENERLLLMIKEKDHRNKDLNLDSIEMDLDIKKLIEENSRLELQLREDQKKYDELKLQFNDVENKVCTEMSHKVRLLMNENDKLSAIINSKNKEVETWKLKYEEIELINKRRCENLELEAKQFEQKNSC